MTASREDKVTTSDAISFEYDTVLQYSDSPDTFPRVLHAQAMYLMKQAGRILIDVLASRYEDDLSSSFYLFSEQHSNEVKGIKSVYYISPTEKVHFIACFESDDINIPLLEDHTTPSELGYVKLESNSIHNFRHGTEYPTILGVVFLQPSNRNELPRPALKLFYPSDGFVDYVPLSSIGESYTPVMSTYLGDISDSEVKLP